MNQEMKNRLLCLNTEALVEMLEAVCQYAEIELNFGQDPADCINEPVFYAHEPHFGSWTVLIYSSEIHDKHKIDMAKDHEHLVRVEAPYCEMCDLLGEAVETGHITAYEVIQSPALKQKPKEMPKNNNAKNESASKKEKNKKDKKDPRVLQTRPWFFTPSDFNARRLDTTRREYKTNRKSQNTARLNDSRGE